MRTKASGRLVSILAVVLVGCASQAPIKMTVPAERDLSQFKRVGIAEFQGRGGDRVRSTLETVLLNARVNGEPYFTVVTQDKLDAVVREQNRGQSIRVDESTAPAIGKLLGVDALVTGNVIEFDTDDRHYNEPYVVTSVTTDGTKTRDVMFSCLERTGRISGDAKFIDVRTGQVTESLPFGGSLTQRNCAERRSQINVPSAEAILSAATTAALKEIVTKITPHDVIRNVELRSKDDGGGGKYVTERLKAGVTYATNGSWPMAISAWEQARQLNPNSAAAHYNLGVGYEAQGQLEMAGQMYKKAAQLNPEPLYIKASSAIEQRQVNADELQRQLSGRE